MTIDYNAGEQIIHIKGNDWNEASHKLGVIGWEDGIVRLFAVEPKENYVSGSEIFITESLPMARGFIHAFEINSPDAMQDITIYVQDYKFYEDAYAVALNMQEGKNNCYS